MGRGKCLPSVSMISLSCSLVVWHQSPRCQPKTVQDCAKFEPCRWELIGEANVFMDFSEDSKGQGKPEKVQDLEGKEWDAVMRGSFHFEFVKAEGGGDNKHGLVLKASHIFAETGSIGS